MQLIFKLLLGAVGIMGSTYNSNAPWDLLCVKKIIHFTNQILIMERIARNVHIRVFMARKNQE